MRPVESPNTFIGFYNSNLRLTGRKSLVDFSCFPAVHTECAKRNFGEILGAFDFERRSGGHDVPVWGHGVMYYLLSTRASTRMTMGRLACSCGRRSNALTMLGSCWILTALFERHCPISQQFRRSYKDAARHPAHNGSLSRAAVFEAPIFAPRKL